MCALFIFFSLISSAKVSLAKMRSFDRLLQPALTQQDDWYLYFDQTSSVSSFELGDKQCECRCETLCGNITSSLNTVVTKNLLMACNVIEIYVL